MKKILSHLQAEWYKYLIEVLVLIIGIYGAFALEEWREVRKDEQSERTLLKNIQEDILLDTLDLYYNLDFHKRFLDNELKLLAFLKSELDQPAEDIIYSDVLGYPIMAVIHTSSFENLKNNDLDLLQNNVLKKDIFRFYDFFAFALTKVEDDFSPYVDKYDQKLVYFQKYFKLKEESVNYHTPESDKLLTQNFNRQEYMIKDVASLKKDEGFRILLAEDAFMRQVRISVYLDVIERIKVLNASIETELNK